MDIQEKAMNRLIGYAKIDTQSDESSQETPTTEGQLKLGKHLVAELQKIGMEDVTMDDNGYVMATLPSNTEEDIPTIGFMAHVDTATDFTGKNVQPQVWQNYNGKDLLLNESQNIVMETTEYPELKDYENHTLITTDGTTLLGADNKAGIAEIMTAMEYLIMHPEHPHGPIRVAFTPDEEIGRGPHKFPVEDFGASLAYTVDGGELGELQYESFNAAAAKITVYGNSVHPGTAKGKMIHASKIAMEIADRFPPEEAPEFTEKREGFYHLLSCNGDVEKAELVYIIRDFDEKLFAHRKQFVEQTIENFQQTYGKEKVALEMHDQYYNMRDKIEPVIEVVEIAEKAMKQLDITPIMEPIRGGTDGAQLSYKGLPTPNLFTGGRNFHGKYEFISVDDMEKAVQTIIGISKLFVEKHS